LVREERKKERGRVQESVEETHKEKGEQGKGRGARKKEFV